MQIKILFDEELETGSAAAIGNYILKILPQSKVFTEQGATGYSLITVTAPSKKEVKLVERL